MSFVNQVPSTKDSNLVKGLAFPYQLGQTSFPAMAAAEDSVFDSITSLILTGKNERVMRTQLGVNLSDFVFENLTPISMARIASAVTTAIEEWEPRAEVLSVIPTVGQNADAHGTTIFVDLVYRIAGQNYRQQIPIPLPSV